MCLYPKIIYNPKYKPNKKNGGNIPPVTDYRILGVPIKCGKCIECMKLTAREWIIRLNEDIKQHNNAKFVTLTLSNEQYANLHEYTSNIKDAYTKDNTIATIAVRRFLERYRKKYKKSIRHWLVTELGHNGTENVHLHGLLYTNHPKEEIDKYWQYGFTWWGTWVNGATINYITKYITKIDQDHKYYKPIILTSNGIGAAYITETKKQYNKFNNEKTKEYYKTQTGHKMSLPIYLRNKIYTDEEKEKLWIQKLNKNERWICGEKIKLEPHREEEYYKLLQWHRERNKLLGYGNDEINWNRKQYEQERRLLIQKERITPSAGSLAKGIGLYNRPPIKQDTSDLKGRNIQPRRNNGVAPAVGCERIHFTLIHTIPKLMWIKEIGKYKTTTNLAQLLNLKNHNHDNSNNT